MAPNRYLEWCNSQKLSDITIEYGHEGKLKFFGHRVVLCKSSEWFRKAFLGPFVEADSKTIRLEEDNPDHLLAMLTCCYEDDPGACLKDALPEDPYGAVMWVLGLYIVADKYMVRSLKGLTALSLKHIHLETYLNSLNDSKDAEQEKDQLRAIIEAAYGLVGDEAHDNIQTTISTQLLQHEHTSMLGKFGKLTSFMIELMREIPEFAQDLCLGLIALQHEDHAKRLNLTRWIKCPSCKYAWPKIRSFEFRCCPKLDCQWYSGCWRVFVQLSSGQRFTLHVAPSVTVDEVKSRIQERTGTPGETQLLLFRGYELQNGDLLAEYRFKSGRTLVLA